MKSVPTSVSGYITPFFSRTPCAQELQVYLMADAEARWDDPQIVECLCPPLQKLIAFAITTELALHIETERVGSPEIVDLH